MDTDRPILSAETPSDHPASQADEIESIDIVFPHPRWGRHTENLEACMKRSNKESTIKWAVVDRIRKSGVVQLALDQDHTTLRLHWQLAAFAVTHASDFKVLETSDFDVVLGSADCILIDEDLAPLTRNGIHSFFCHTSKEDLQRQARNAAASRQKAEEGSKKIIEELNEKDRKARNKRKNKANNEGGSSDGKGKEEVN